MKNLVKAACLVAAAIVLITIQANATSLMNESFTYSDGDLTNVSSAASFPWTTFSGVGGPIQISGGSVVGLGTSTAAQDSSRQINGSTFTTGTDLYFSFQLTMTTIPSSTTGSQFFFGLDTASPGAYRDRIFTKQITSTTFQLGVANAASALGSASNTTTLALGTTYLVVGKYHIDNTTLANTTSTLWINPTLETDFSVTATDAPGSAAIISRVSLRQPTAATEGVMTLDNLLVGTTFADVVVVPEPTTWALVGVGMLGACLLRRRRS